MGEEKLKRAKTIVELRSVSPKAAEKPSKPPNLGNGTRAAELQSEISEHMAHSITSTSTPGKRANQPSNVLHNEIDRQLMSFKKRRIEPLQCTRRHSDAFVETTSGSSDFPRPAPERAQQNISSMTAEKRQLGNSSPDDRGNSILCGSLPNPFPMSQRAMRKAADTGGGKELPQAPSFQLKMSTQAFQNAPSKAKRKKRKIDLLEPIDEQSIKQSKASLVSSKDVHEITDESSGLAGVSTVLELPESEPAPAGPAFRSPLPEGIKQSNGSPEPIKKAPKNTRETCELNKLNMVIEPPENGTAHSEQAVQSAAVSKKRNWSSTHRRPNRLPSDASAPHRHFRNAYKLHQQVLMWLKLR